MTSRQTAFALSVSAAALACGAGGWSVAQAGSLTGPTVIGLLSGAAAVGSAFFVRRFIIAGEEEVHALRADVAKREAEIANSRREVELFEADVAKQLDQRATQLNAREQHLSHLQVNFREWLEYPQAEDETDPLSEVEQRQLTEKDQQVLKRIEDESQQLYRKLREGYYKPEGKIDATLIREDVHQFVLGVAKIYRPDVENPLLETSVDQLLRAASRACLHLLVVLERLPFNPKGMSISTLHGYVQKALKAYDAYVAAKPYLGYVQTASYFGRWLAGATPLTLGVSLLVTELGKRGTQAAAQWLIDQQAVALLHEVTRVIGFEVASIFSGDFRHRDPNWVYAAELTNLMSLFPLSRDNLSQSLREVGSLSFRNEYDRIYLYRCLSAQKAPKPLVAAHEFLTLADRQQVGKRLERFFQAFIHGKQPKLVEDWVAGVEQRLAIKLVPQLALAGPTTAASPEQERLKCLRALAGFLLSFKAAPLEELADRFVITELFRQLNDAERASFTEAILSEPPSYEVPDIERSGSIAPLFVADLGRLAVRSRPWDVQPDELVLETAVMLGQDVEKAQKQLAREYSDALASQFAKDAVAVRLEGNAARAVLAEMRADEQLRFAYAPSSIQWPSTATLLSGARQRGLVGTTQRLLLVEAADREALIATHELSGLSMERVSKMVLDDCKLTGSSWVLDNDSTPVAITAQLAGVMGARYENTFKPLMELVLQRD